MADAALKEGGEVVGVISKALIAREVAQTGLTELHVVGSMHKRKKPMPDLSDGFVALPGGYGTLEEFCEVLYWAQLGIHEKPCGLLDVNSFWEPLISLLDKTVRRTSSPGAPYARSKGESPVCSGKLDRTPHVA